MGTSLPRPMVIPLLIALGFLLVGLALLRQARRSLRTGVAEPDESGPLHRDRRPVSFACFVGLQALFGVVFLGCGAALAWLALRP